MGRHVRGQAKHLRRKKSGALWQKLAAGAVSSSLMVAAPLSWAEAQGTMETSAVHKESTAVQRAQDNKKEAALWVSGYKFSGENPVTDEELTALLAGHRHHEATLPDLEEQAGEVQKYLRNKGYFVAQAYIPPQGFERGLVEIRIVPGRYDQVEFANESYVTESALRREMGVTAGDLVTKDNLERGIWLTGDLSRVEAKTQLMAGAKPGTTKLKVTVKPKGKRMWGFAGFDNGGYRYTGRYQYSAFVNYASPFRNGDLFSLGGVLSSQGKSTWSGSATYVTPLFSQGNKLGIGYARSQYALGGAFAAQGFTGEAEVLSVWWEHNFKRSRNSNVYGIIRWDSKQLTSQAEALPYSNPKRVNNIVYTLRGDSVDTWGTGGKNTWSLSYTNGDLTIEDEIQRQVDAMTGTGVADGMHTAGRFGKYNLNLTRLQRLDDRWALYLSYNRQWAEKNLDSAEKMSLGGPYGVRAYPIGEAAGDDGWLWTTELRWNLPAKENDDNTWQLIAFADGGHVDAYHDGNSRNTARGNGRSLYGAGIGLNWSNTENWAARLHYAWKIGSEKAESDKDANGRLWFQLYRFF